MEKVEEKYMARCIALARHGAGNVSPNPMVGSVIVHKGEIIGEGYHRRYGESHAEVNAIASVKDPSLLREATLYVNLEPCAHYGKTPPCAGLIIEKGIPRVVIGVTDPYLEVSGRGIAMLREAGVDVVTGVMEKEAGELNRPFMVSHTWNRPYIILKWAQSADGMIDRVRKDASTPPEILSSPGMIQRIHKQRAETDAIMIGTRTALLDNPSLTVRHWVGKSPVRVIIDRSLSIPPDYHVLDGRVRTLVFTGMEKESAGLTDYIRIDYDRGIIPQVLSHLFSRRLNSLMVEGGACLVRSFLQEGMWDEIQVETAPVRLGYKGVQAPDIAWQYRPTLHHIETTHTETGQHYITSFVRDWLL
ncbi:MAG: bifunctional diaminohydroxyphosphoribosylaminopyrimidine deaminase/5-amino-6-(5-phosphoribosylamino)uracil reductase RibD [Tannerellaceae bacterium]|jgi:diaminohydroxyphosphoribosylaminopyrimidine deaminase/5-amino-6-(5-phosphoribosylamino)uracil reductase|nr:bifunctional diaminohydroxyphosphoribosylaminopyrimidine deaminase/5-amino-6-(5-phosphoribosylamino)uracil reductase RibD [Tannerellaceae bacterium]